MLGNDENRTLYLKSALKRYSAGDTVEIDLDSDVMAALGVETYAEDGTLKIELGGLLDALGAEVTFDEATGTITVEDEYGAIAALMAILGG